ncbi:MAG: glycosyltransferase [Flavobacteriaceae bacterium]
MTNIIGILTLDIGFKFMIKKLHIVSFDVPYPPNYGGVIDVFYKIKALHKLGLKIILHTYSYGRGEPDELNQYCEQVIYYKRGSFFNFFSRKPFIVKTRNSDALRENLMKDDYPILFEGIHTTFPLIDKDFKTRKILIRTHNIEHDYYAGLSKSEKNIFKKVFFNFESKKLKYYEKIIDKVDAILTISPSEQEYFKTKYGDKCNYIPVFHKNNEVVSLSKKGEFALYHGDLRVADNIKAVDYLVSVFKTLKHQLIIASSFGNKEVIELIKPYKNIQFELLEYQNQDHLASLFEKAHINVLPTFQQTGIKLKLIHALFSSRFCVVNTKMVDKTGLEPLCEVAQNKKEFSEKVNLCFSKEYTEEIRKIKDNNLKDFNTLQNAKKILEHI